MEKRKEGGGERNNCEKSPKVKVLVGGTKEKEKKCRHAACDTLAEWTLPAKAKESHGLFISDARLQFGVQTQ